MKNYTLEEIESCEIIGDFQDEYVYDVEVDDETHTFIANDILVHNSLFVSFKPPILHSEWKNLIFNSEYLESVDSKFVILSKHFDISFINNNFMGTFDSIKSLKEFTDENEVSLLLIDGSFLKNRELKDIDLENYELKWNWSNELDYIHGIDFFRYADYFKEKLDEHAVKYGVENKEDFELERISESVINVAKKKYIQHIVYEDGISFDRLNYFFPKGVELVRSSTPLFARDKIMDIVKYLFSKPDSFNIRDLLKLVKNLKKEFDLCVPDKIDEISMQSSCSNYEEKVINDKDRLNFVSATHFAVKASAYYNHLLYKNPSLQEKYEFIKSGSKIKFYYCKDRSINDIFAYIRGSYPIEFAPDIDLNTQFSKCILSPINSIIEPLGLPVITDRLSVVMSIFG